MEQLMGPIVAVDDNPDILELLEMLIMAEGFQIETFSDGTRALSYILENKPIAIITDQNIPGKTGIELLKEVHQAIGEVLSFLISGDPPNQLVSAGCPDFVNILGKPFDTTELIDIIKDTYKI